MVTASATVTDTSKGKGVRCREGRGGDMKGRKGRMKRKEKEGRRKDKREGEEERKER